MNRFAIKTTIALVIVALFVLAIFASSTSQSTGNPGWVKLASGETVKCDNLELWIGQGSTIFHCDGHKFVAIEEYGFPEQNE